MFPNPYPISGHRKVPQDESFNIAMRNKFVNKGPASLKSSVVAPHSGQWVTEFENLNATGIITPWVCKG